MNLIVFLALACAPLFPNAEDRLAEIEQNKNYWKPLIMEQEQQNPSFFHNLYSCLERGSIERIEEGNGGSYLIHDENQNPVFIIKPSDEDIYCLNNPKDYASISLEPRARTNIPLYRSAQTQAFCYQLAKICGLEPITPPTYLGIVYSDSFFLTSSKGSLEKLCAIQEYLQETLPLYTVLQNFFTSGLEDHQIESFFDPEDFAALNLFLWLIYDNDAHVGNFRAYVKQVTIQGTPIYGLKKIDNSLSLPEKNSDFFSFLMYFPNAKREIPEMLQKKILEIPLWEIQQRLEDFDLSSAFPSFLERVQVLQELITRPRITYYEINARLLLLEKEEGISLALSALSLEELSCLVPPHL